jgi:hypothetical protein
MQKKCAKLEIVLTQELFNLIKMALQTAGITNYTHLFLAQQGGGESNIDSIGQLSLLLL